MIIAATVLCVLYIVMAIGSFVMWLQDIESGGGLLGIVICELIVFIVFATIGSGTLLLYTMMTRGVPL